MAEQFPSFHGAKRVGQEKNSRTFPVVLDAITRFHAIVDAKIDIRAAAVVGWPAPNPSPLFSQHEPGGKARIVTMREIYLCTNMVHRTPLAL
jgi:hypothetical protein